MSLPMLTFFIGSLFQIFSFEQIFWILRLSLHFIIIRSIFPPPSCLVISRHIAEPIAGEGASAAAGEARGRPLLDIIPVSWAETGGQRLYIDITCVPVCERKVTSNLHLQWDMIKVFCNSGLFNLCLEAGALRKWGSYYCPPLSRVLFYPRVEDIFCDDDPPILYLVWIFVPISAFSLHHIKNGQLTG